MGGVRQGPPPYWLLLVPEEEGWGREVHPMREGLVVAQP